MSKRIDNLVGGVGSFIAKRRGHHAFDVMANLIKHLYFKSENFDYNHKSNGELNLLDELSKFGFTEILDVGANVGNWAVLARGKFKSSKIHCFELSPKTFKILLENLGGNESFVLNNYGLSNENKEVVINHVIGNSGNSSIYTRIINSDAQLVEEIPSRVETLDSYIEKLNIGNIDFLKIDTEGSDHLVLQGAAKALGSGKIKVIQFEYGMAAVETRFLLKDFYSLLNENGYLVGKIFPRHIKFSEYSRSMEDFIGPNFLAVHKTQFEILKGLGYSGTL